MLSRTLFSYGRFVGLCFSRFHSFPLIGTSRQVKIRSFKLRLHCSFFGFSTYPRIMLSWGDTIRSFSFLPRSWPSPSCNSGCTSNLIRYFRRPPKTLLEHIWCKRAFSFWRRFSPLIFSHIVSPKIIIHKQVYCEMRIIPTVLYT